MLAIVKLNQVQAKSLQLRLLASCAMATSMLSVGAANAAASGPPPTPGANTAFQGTGTVVSGSATIVQTATLDTITVGSSNTVINFAPFDTANGGGPIAFLPSGRTGLFQNDPNSGVTNFTVLNRIVPTDATRAIRFDGTVQSRIANATGGSSPGGTILFYSPGGIIASSTSVFDVGSLVLSAADIDFGELSNSFRFSGATPGAAVDINVGALITARAAGSYVALVAPRVVQSGTVKSDGSVAYIAAEAVDVTIQNNLFDINFVQGTDGGTAINHGGTTELTRAPNDTTAQRIYVAAVPKNDAITTLVSGSLGYSPATEASIQNGSIILSAGRNIIDTGGATNFVDFAGGEAPASISIGRDSSSVFNSSVLANATGDAIIAADAEPIHFSNNVSLSADRLAEVRIIANTSASFDANLSVNSANVLKGAAARVIALGEAGYGGLVGAINVGGNLSINGGEGATALAELAADLGRISVIGNTSVVASTIRPFGLNGNPDATGGTATVRVGAAGSQLSLANLLIDTSASAGRAIVDDDTLVNGTARGGNATLTLGGGALISESVALNSTATSLRGGTAIGGTASVLASGGMANTSTISANVSAIQAAPEPVATAPMSIIEGGFTPNAAATTTITGGTIQLDVINTTMNVNGDLLLNANAMASNGEGNVQGGGININVDNGRLLVGDEIIASASAEDTGFMAGTTPVEVGGGTIAALVAGGGRILSSFMNYTANATSGGDSFAGLVSLTTNSGGGIRSVGDLGLNAAATVRSGEAGGNATGGTLLVNINSGSFQSGPVLLDASARGGSAAATLGARGGDAIGGTAQVNISGGASNVSVFNLNSNANAGFGSSGNGEAPGGAGGNARGGTSEVNITGGEVTTAGFLITSLAVGGSGGSNTGASGGLGGDAIGGTARVTTNEAAALRINKLLVEPAPTPQRTMIDSSARGGAGGTGRTGGAGGGATGGTSTLILTNAALEAISPQFAVDVSVNSEANGGIGGGNVGYGTGGDGGLGGSATGGRADVTLINNHFNFGSIALSTRGSGGSGGNAGNSGYGSLPVGGAGGNATGGVATLIASAPVENITPTNIGNLAITSEAVGGSGGIGAVGGNGGNAINTGIASFTQTGGGITIPTSVLTANSFGGRGASSFGGNGGNGGNGLGGTARITANGASTNLTINVASALAVGTSGAGGNAQFSQNPANGGNAGTATGGTAEILAKNGAVANLTLTAIANARSFGELGGSSSDGNGGAGGAAIGGIALIDGSGGSLSAVDLTSISGGSGGSGGGANDGYGGLGNGGVGGLATGGSSAIVNVNFNSQNSTAFVGAFALGGAGGSGSSGNGNGGDGGAATGGAARVDGRGDLLTASNLTVTAGVIAGAGGNAGYGGLGDGGAGGTGTGGTATVTNARSNSQNSIAFFGTNAGGGNGGTGRIAGNGGAAIAGTTRFIATDIANVIGTIDVSASSAGGMGGAQSAGSSGGRGGNGGTGQGGDAQLSVSGGAFNASNVMVRGTAGGGAGGFGETGGNGGLATGGVTLLSSAAGAVTQIGTLELRSGAGGGSGGQASVLGGNGGDALAGTAALNVSGGTFQASDILIRGAAAGGTSDLDGNGGSAVAGTARLTALNNATLNLGNVSIIADAFANSFVTQDNTQPTANTATSATSGHATGGLAELNVSNGSALFGGAVTLSANATIENGGSDGDEDGPTAPFANGATPDGTATGGAVSVSVNNATVSLSQALNLSANGQALIGVGQGGAINILATSGLLSTPSTVATANGSALVNGTELGGRGGTISIRAETVAGGTTGALNLGSLNLEASGFSTPANGSEVTPNADAGRITIAANSDQATAVNFSTLTARTLGRNAAGFNPNAGIFLSANKGRINSSGAVTLLSDESVGVSAVGTGNLFVGNDLNAEALNIITIDHAGRPASANTILAANVNLTAGNDFNAMPGSRIRSDNDLAILSRLGAVSAGDLVAGDDVLVTARNGAVSILSAAALGIGLDAPANRSNIVIDSGAAVNINNANAQSTLAVRGTNITGTNLTTGEDVALSATGNISATGVLAGDDFSATSSGGNITLGTITTSATGLDDRTVDFGYGEIGFAATPANGSRIDANAGYGNISLGILNSAGATNLMASGNITGGTSTASGPLSVMADTIDIDNLTSAGGSVNASARIVDIGTSNAGLDIIINTKGLANGRIILGAATAARDISLTAGAVGGLPNPTAMSSIVASNLTAGDDIDAFATNNVNITSALADGSFNSGYGSDLSNINITTSLFGSANLTTGRARDNLTITTGIGGANSTGSLTADRGDILVNGQMSANIAQATATLGSVTLNAAFVSADNVSAGTDANVNFFVNGRLGTVAATRDVIVNGSGPAMLTANSLVAGNDVTVMTGGNAAITSARAGRNLRNTSANLTATSLGAGTDVIILTDAAANLGTTTAGARIVANAGSRIDFTQLMSGTATALIAGASISGGNANAGSTLTLDASGGAIGFGMLSSVSNTSITATGAISGNSADAGGALALNSGANGITATTLSSGSNSNLTVTASNGGSAAITTARSGLDLSVNATNVSVMTGRAARDVLYSASDTVDAGQTNADRDILFNAGSIIISGTATALNNLTANSAGGAQLTSSMANNIFVVAAGNATLGTADAATMLGVNATNIVGTMLTAGEDIRLTASGTANVTSATAGDDIDISGATGLTLGTITTRGTARDDRSLVFNAPSFSIVGSAPNGSDISLTSNGAVSAANLNSGDDIRVNSATFSGTTSSAARMIDVMTSGNQLLGTANASQGPITGTSTAGMISFIDLTSGGAINLDAANGIGGGNANAAGAIQFMGRNGTITFGTLTSGGSTNLSNGAGISGSAINAGSAAQLNSDVINIGALSSRFDSVFVTGRDITIGTSDALFDIIVDTRPSANSRITLGTATAGRDIVLSGANNGLTATSLLAGDDIEIDITGNAKINLARTIGSSNTAYGDTGYGGDGYGDVGYGGDMSDIRLSAAQAMIGIAQAADNVTLATATGTTANVVIADRGAILVNGGTSANLGQATATLGSITLNADNVTADSANAADTFSVNFLRNASLGTVNAGNSISVLGIGDASITALTSGGATNIMTGGSVSGGTATAGGLLSVMTDMIDVDSLTSTGNSVMASARSVDIGSTTAAIDALIDTKGLANSSITLGTVNARRDISLTGGTNGIAATSLTAGDDIDVIGSGSAMITSALTTGSGNTGYGDVGYGSDPSNITLSATQAIIGTARARDNVTLTTPNGTTATALTADRGAITVRGGTLAAIDRANATLANVDIMANSVSSTAVNAATDVAVVYDSGASLGAVNAGRTIDVRGTGNGSFTSLTAGTTTFANVGAALSGGSINAGTSLNATTVGAFTTTGPITAGTSATIMGGSITTANASAGGALSLSANQGAIRTANLTGGTGVQLRGSGSATTGNVTATANNVDIVIAGGLTGGNVTAANNIVIGNTTNAVTAGALSAGNNIAVNNGGAVMLASATASDVVLTSTASSINAGAITARGALTGTAANALTLGTAISGSNIALTGRTINATALTAANTLTATANGAIDIGTARATGGNLSLTAAGALSAMNGSAAGNVNLTSSNGGNISTGTLSSGTGDIAITSDGNATMTGNSSAGRNLNVTARGLLSVGGVANGLSIDLRSSDIAVNATSGRIGEQGRTTLAQLTNTGGGVTTIGGAGVTTGYSLSNAEAQRFFAGDIIITAARTASPPAGTQTPSTLNAAAPDVVLDTLTLTGANGQTGATAGNIGTSGRLRIETPGKLRTVGAVAISNLGTANRFQLNAAQSIEVDAATGSISLSGAGGALGGTLELTAPSVIAASLTAIGAVAAAVDGRTINDRLAINDGLISDAGAFSANGIIVNVTDGFFVQNSGIKELSAFSFGDRRGVTVGSGGLTINAASPTTRIFVSGRQVQANGSFITGVDFLRQQTINGTKIQLSTFPPTSFDTASTINGCAIINSAACLITIDGGSIARDVIGQSDDETSRNGSSSDANFVQFQFKNLDEANFQPVIDDPVTGVGNDDLYALYDARDCTDDQSLEGCTKPK
jgi:hypothetical protein